MPLTASFTEYRRELTAITNAVMRDRVPVTVFKNSKPAFKVVPIDPITAETDMQAAYLDAASDVDSEYHDVFEALSR